MQFVLGDHAAAGVVVAVLAGSDDRAEQHHRTHRGVRVLREHRVQAEGALAFRDDVHRLAGQFVQPPQLRRDPVAKFRQRKVARLRAVGQGLAAAISP